MLRWRGINGRVLLFGQLPIAMPPSLQRTVAGADGVERWGVITVGEQEKIVRLLGHSIMENLIVFFFF